MRRRFRRRPSFASLVLLFVLLLVSFRVWQRLVQQNQAPRRIEEQVEGAYQVVQVVDGTTLIVSKSQSSAPSTAPKQSRVHLLSVQLPTQSSWPTNTDKWQGQAASFTQSFVNGGKVRLRFDKNRQNRNGDWLAYVYVKEDMLNESLVRQGLAQVEIQQGNSLSLGRILQNAQREAQVAKRGMWSE